jgi:hypothetical protein
VVGDGRSKTPEILAEVRHQIPLPTRRWRGPDSIHAKIRQRGLWAGVTGSRLTRAYAIITNQRAREFSRRHRCADQLEPRRQHSRDTCLWIIMAKSKIGRDASLTRSCRETGGRRDSSPCVSSQTVAAADAMQQNRLGPVGTRLRFWRIRDGRKDAAGATGSACKPLAARAYRNAVWIARLRPPILIRWTSLG